MKIGHVEDFRPGKIRARQTWVLALLLSACTSTSPMSKSGGDHLTERRASRELSNLVAAQDLFCVTEGADMWCWGRAEGLIARPIVDEPAIDPKLDSRWREELELRAQLAEALSPNAVAVPRGMTGTKRRQYWACALEETAVRCGYDGELSAIKGLPAVSKLAVGWNKDQADGGPLACAWSTGKDVFCWGTPRSNAFSAAERPLSEGDWLEPRAVPAHQGAIELAIDGTGRICSLHDGGTVQCTGRYRTNTLQRVPLDGVVAIEPMWLAVTRSGTTHHWGYGSSWGYLHARPAPVGGADDIVEIFGDTGRRSDGSLWKARRDLVWADLRLTLPLDVQLDSGTGCFEVSGWETPQARPLKTEIDVGERATPLNTCFSQGGCGIDDSGSVTCVSATSEPKEQPDLAPARLAGGREGSGCLVRPEGTLACWNRRGDARELIEVEGPSEVVHLSVSGNRSGCVIESDGELWCWGVNSYDVDRRELTPRKIDGIKDAMDVAVRYDSACAVERSGALYCWGDASLGALGNGTGLHEAVEIQFAR